MYNYAPELDENMKTSLKNTAQAEDDLGYTWDISAPEEEAAVQLESDPICSSAGCKKTKSKKHPMDYFVPNFGRDTDILATENSLDVAQKTTNHTWEFTFQKPPVNPAAKTLYDFDPELDEEVSVSLANTAKAEEALNYEWDIQREVDQANV